jgi:ribosomal protein S19E (S16A)
MKKKTGENILQKLKEKGLVTDQPTLGKISENINTMLEDEIEDLKQENKSLAQLGDPNFFLAF